MELAQIGFAADTSDLDRAAGSLQKLIPASAAVEKSAIKTSTALSDVSASAAKVNKAATGTAAQTGAISKVMKAATGDIGQQTNAAKTAAGANDNLAKSHAGLSTQAMAAQHSIRSMVEQLAMGVPPSQVLTTQLNHLAYAASGPGGLKQAFGDAFASLTKLISGTVAFAAGGVAIAAAIGAIAASAIKSALALEDLRTMTDLTLKQASGLQSMAAIKGIAKDEFAQGLIQFATSVDDAQHNMGSLNGLMIASGKSAKDMVGYLAKVADIVAQTNSNVQKRNILEAAGLPTTAKWVQMMNQGGDAIRSAAQGTSDFDTAANENLIANARKFDEMWNGAIASFKNNFINATVGITSAFETFYDKVASKAAGFGSSSFWKSFYPPDHEKIAKDMGITTIPNDFAGRFGQFQQPANTAQLASGLLNSQGKGSPADPTKLLAENQQAQQRIGILGDLATVEQQVTQKRLELNAAGLQGIGVGKNMAAAILNNTRAMAEMNRVQQQASIGIYNETATQKAAADTLQSWIDKKLVDKTNAEQMAAAHLVLARNIQATKDAAAIAAAPLQQLKQLELDGSNLSKNLDTALTGSLYNMVQPIQDMMNGVTGLSQGFKNLGIVVLQALQQMIVKMLIITPIARALQGVMSNLFGGFGGGIAGLFGFSSGGVPGAVGPTSLGGAPLIKNALGGVYNTPTLTAYSGTIVSNPTMFRFASGAGLMGEAGPEGILPLKRGPSGALGVQMFGSQSSNDNSASPVAVTYAPTYQIGGKVSQDDLDKIKRAQAEDRKQFTANVANSMQQLRRRNVGV